MWKTETVYEWEKALLYVDGAFQRILPAGRHRLFALGRRVQVFRVANYPTYYPSGAIEVITADRFALRLGVAVMARICDPRAAVEGQSQYHQALLLAVAEAAVALVSERSLDDLISQRADLSAALLDRLAGKVAELEIQAVTIQSLTLPPEVRRMLTEVERARQEGAAALERARGEHASLRSLANAARLLKDNPELMRLRTLQAVSPTGKGATLVLGQHALDPTRSAD